MATRLSVLPSAPTEQPGASARALARRPAPGSLRVGLVNMPFSSSRCPSIQLGLLQAVLQGHGLDVTSHYLNLRFAAQIGWDRFEELCTRCSAHLIGDWIFSAVAFGDEAPPGARYLEAFATHVEEICESMEADVERLVEIRDHEVPAFMDACMEEVAWGDYDVVGFSSVFQQNCAALALARRIKQRFPAVTIVFGGANFEGDAGLEQVRAIPWIDYAVIGEGEVTFPALLERLAAGDRQPQLPGVAYARDDEVVYGGRAPMIHDLEAAPPPNYDDFFTMALATEVPAVSRGVEILLPFESARGCWWGQKHHCTFCGLNTTQMQFRRKSAERVRQEIDGLARRYGVLSFLATDNIMDHRMAREVFDAFHAEHKDYSVFYEVKANLKQADIRALARGGVRIMQPGIESLNTHVLTLMDKGVRGIQNVRFLKWARYYDIMAAWHILRGFPGETAEDYADQLATLRLIGHLQPPRGTTQRIRLERFSPNFDHATEFGFTNVRPGASYACIYPPDIDHEKVAYFFEYDAPGSLPDEVYAPTDELLRRWSDAWYGPRRPYLRYQRGPDRLTVFDGRDPQAPRVELVQGPSAFIYEQCGPTYRTARELVSRLRREHELELSQAEIEDRLEALTERGLMLREDDCFLALALPTNPHW